MSKLLLARCVLPVTEHGRNDAKKGALLARKRLDTTPSHHKWGELGASLRVRMRFRAFMGAKVVCIALDHVSAGVGMYRLVAVYVRGMKGGGL
jgi:hypothetical protein